MPARRCSWSSRTARPQIPLWRGRFGTPAGWPYNTAGFGFSAWIAIVAVATLRHRVLPVWTAWIGVPVALIGFVGPFAVKAGTGPFSPQGWFALVVGLTFAAWLVAVSLATWRSTREPTSTSAGIGAHQEEPA